MDQSRRETGGARSSRLMMAMWMGLAVMLIAQPVPAKAQPRQAGQAGMVEQVIRDFEGNQGTLGWSAATGDVKLSAINDPTPRRSGKVLRMDFGPSDWRRAQLGLSSSSTGLWEGWDTFEFDIYNDSPHTVSLRVQLEAGGVHNGYYKGTMTLEPRQWYHYTMSARRFPGHTPESLSPRVIDSISFIGHANHTYPSRVRFYVDNLKLTHRAGPRLAALDALLGGVGGEGKAAADTTHGDTLEAIKAHRQTLARLKAEARQANPDDRPKMEALSAKVTESQTQAMSLLSTLLDEEIDHLIHMGIEIPGVREPGVPATLEPLFPSRDSEAQQRLDRQVSLIAQVQDRLAQRLAQARHAAQTRRVFAGSPLTVGIPDTPTALTDEPYTGPMATSVRLWAARHEYEPFQLVVLAGDKPLKGVTVTMSPLVGPGRIEGEHIEVAPMGWRKEMNGPWVADMLRPDIASFDVAAGKHQPVWVNVYVADDTPPGDYTGVATVSAEGVSPVKVAVTLTVWPFTLPKFSSLQTATWDNLGIHQALKTGQYDDHARMLINHRWSPVNIYLSHRIKIPLEMRQRHTQWGATLHNLLRVSYRASKFDKLEDGSQRVSDATRQMFFKQLDPIVNEIKQRDPDFLKHVMIYGYDEPPTSVIPAMDEFYGELKKRYDNIQISFATMYPIWETYPEIKNVDIWAVVQSIMTPEVLADLHAQGKRVWWYNIYARHRDPVGTRVQYWATFKDGFDGMLHYSLADAGEGTSPTKPKASKWGQSLWPDTPRTDGGIKRITEDNRPISTVALEYWREGMEDVEYLYILRGLRDRLAPLVTQASPAPLRALLREADQMVRVPDNLTPGIMGNRAKEEGEVVVELWGHTKDMRTIMQARHHVAGLVQRLEAALANPASP